MSSRKIISKEEAKEIVWFKGLYGWFFYPIDLISSEIFYIPLQIHHSKNNIDYQKYFRDVFYFTSDYRHFYDLKTIGFPGVDCLKIKIEDTHPMLDEWKVIY